MDVDKINKIMQAVTWGIPEDEVCESDEERFRYRLLKRGMENPRTSGQGFWPVAD